MQYEMVRIYHFVSHWGMNLDSTVEKKNLGVILVETQEVCKQTLKAANKLNWIVATIRSNVC